MSKIKSILSRFKKMSKFEKTLIVLLFLWLFYNYSPTNVVVRTFEPELTDDGRVGIAYFWDSFSIGEEGWKDNRDLAPYHFVLNRTRVDYLFNQEETKVTILAKGWFIRFREDIPDYSIKKVTISCKPRAEAEDQNIIDFISLAYYTVDDEENLEG